MIRCNICQTRLDYRFTKLGFRIYQCPDCRLLRTRLKSKYTQLLRRYYNRDYYLGGSNRAGYANYDQDTVTFKKNAAFYLKSLDSVNATGKLLDVGCATGLFINQARQHGYQAYGLDPSAYAVAQARKNFGNSVKQATLLSAKFPPSCFNIVTMIDVIEHLDNPRANLKKAWKLLKRNGTLLIHTGNSDSLWAKIKGQSWHYFIPPQHIHFFSRTNLIQLLRSEGFEPIKILQNGKFLSLRYLFHLMRTITQSKLADIAYRLIADKSIGQLGIYLNLGDNITLLARKRVMKRVHHQ